MRAPPSASTRLWSLRLRRNPEAQSAPERVNIALGRLANVLDANIVCGIRTLEAKISEAGPRAQRVDPRLVSIALAELVSRRRVRAITHHSTGTQSWYAYPRHPPHVREAALDRLAQIH